MAQKDSSVFGSKNFFPNGLAGKIYLLPDTTQKLPDFDTMKSMGTIYTKEINISTRSWTEGFPGVTDRFEWFGIEYKGSFKPKRKGLYIFRLLSDDGAKLFIDGELIINNDGVHSPSSKLGEVKLDTSRHSIKIQYFQGPRTEIALQLFATMQNESEEIFPGNNFTLITPVPDNGLCIIWWTGIILIVILFFIIIFRRRRRRKVAT